MIWRIVPVSYWFVVALIKLGMFLYIRGPLVKGLENIPKRGGAILVANHINNADPVVIPGVVRRRMVFMAKKEIFNWPVGSLLFRLIGAFPVDRQGGGFMALREAERAVSSGLLLLMFPEGARSKNAQLRRGLPGSALVAYRTGVPLIPIAITGTETLHWPFLFLKPLPFLGPRVTVTIGKPFYPPPVERVTTQAAREGSDVIMQHIAELLPEEYRGEYREFIAERERARAEQVAQAGS